MLHLTRLEADERGLSASFASEPPVTIESVRRLQTVVAQVEQVELGLKHHFSDGIYTRECFIPAGVVVVGKLHRHDHPVMLMKGTATIVAVNKDGSNGERTTISAPAVWTSKAGVKRAVMAHDDCWFVTCHATHETDLDAIEDFVIEPEPGLPLGAAFDRLENGEKAA